MSLADRFENVAKGRKKRKGGRDFYATPSEVTYALLNREKFRGNILEPACGAGHMVRALQRWFGPKKKLLYFDIRTKGIYKGKGGIDFLKYKPSSKVANLVTNPPFKDAEAFIRKGLEVTTRKVALLLPLHFLEGKTHWDLFDETPLKAVCVFSERKTFLREGTTLKTKQGFIAFAWYVWQHGWKKEPRLRWLKPGDDKNLRTLID